MNVGLLIQYFVLDALVRVVVKIPIFKTKGEQIPKSKLAGGIDVC